MSDVIVHEHPELRSPRLVVAFAGWPDAAETASRTVSVLQERLRATRFAEIRYDDFFSPMVLRPTTVIREGRIEALRFPTNDLYYWQNPDAPQDLIFLVGKEPHMHWRRFVGALLDLAQEQRVSAVYALGGLYDNVPHTRPVRISSVVEDADLRRRLSELGLVFTDYEGPSSIHTTLLAECRARQVPAASLWGHAPGYAQLSWNPRVTYVMLETMSRLLGVQVDLTEVGAAAGYLDQALDRLVDQNPQVRALVHKLEQEYGPTETRRLSEPLQISENVLREVEEILKRQEEGHGQEGDSGQTGDPGGKGNR